MGDAFAVESSRGMLEFFLHASGDLHRYVSRLTGGDQQLTEDLVQETFIALLRHHREGDDEVLHVGWLKTTARHRLIDHARSRGREQARIERYLAGERVEEPPSDTGQVSAEHARWMLAQLPVHERVALALHTVEGMSVAEVAEALDRSVEATTSLLARARRRLRGLALESVDG